MYILNSGVRKINKKSFITRLFCKHDFVEGEVCSSLGLTRISGEDVVVVCVHCGKIAKAYSVNY